MNLSERWLREWVDPPASVTEICARLNMAGIEATAAPLLAFSPERFVVGRIVACEPHPQADRLRVCRVDTGEGEPRQIVCGAPNARVGLVAPTALPGAVLPDGKSIGEATLRGVASAGMLCSAAELGLSDKAGGLLELDADARAGTPLAEHLALNDQVITLELTPNRGDCLSIRGLAREVAALYERPLARPRRAPVPAAMDAALPIRIAELAACPAYAGRVIRGIDPLARTPDWMRERLARSGIRAIHPLVDVTNYVMLELGQPMHAFDLARLSGAIEVRFARAGENLLLLNDQTVALSGELVIADIKGALALAGVMGGAASAVSATTTDVFLESAYFTPEAVAGTGRRFQLHSDALHRFERGVDPTLQVEALERASELILAHFGGKAGPATFAGGAPDALTVRMRTARIARVLGHAVDETFASAALERLGMSVDRTDADYWEVGIPAARHDLRLEVDLIEEIGRVYGYDRIPPRAYKAALRPAARPEGRRALEDVRQAFAAHGYFEAVTYSFVDPAVQALLQPAQAGIALDNPIAETLGVMRTTLWSGLLPALRYNLQRQQDRVRLYEAGRCYAAAAGGCTERMRIAAVAAGTALPEQWGSDARTLDIFDLKGDLHGVLALPGDALEYHAGGHPALHPGRSATVLRAGLPCGVIGELHPRLVQALELSQAPCLFELDWEIVSARSVTRAQPVGEFPTARRDIAVVVADSVQAQAVEECVRRSGGGLLREVKVFDVYRGAELPAGCKSLALGLIFQDYSRTLTDKEIENVRGGIVARLSAELGAALRA